VTTSAPARRRVATVGDLVATLAPEIVGLAVTPAAVIACLMLLGSSHPYRNVACLAGVFLVVYGVICVVVVALGRVSGTSTDDPSTAHGWAGLVVGILFLVGGVVSWLRPPRVVATAETTSVPLPGWAARLRDPSVKLVLAVALVLAVLNPNIAILASGLTLLVARDSGAEQLVGVALLLAGSMVDFALPTLAFVVGGERGRAHLRSATLWLIAHNRVIGIVVLLAFGLLFAGRGLVQVLG
jgi:Sap-like sulfolipid-1-addressing protein